MRLNKALWQSVKFGMYVDHFEENEVNNEVRSNAKYVSLEHIETGNLRINTWLNEEMPTFFRTFKPGHILFGKRRAYQRKVAIADFEGICSPHIWALYTQNNLLQDLLPYIMLTDKFYEYVNANSAGTMSVYIKWAQLSEFQFQLPPLEEQKQIFALFQSVETAIEQVEEQGQRLKVLWKNLINGFVNEKPKFGNLLSDKTLRKVSYREVAKKIMQKIDPLKYGIERMVAGENLESENFKISTWGDVRKEFIGPAFHVLFQPGDILYGSRRTYLKKVALADFEGVCANTTFVIRAEEDILLQSLLKHIMLSDEFTEYSVGASKGSTNPYINWKDLDNFSFFIPDIETQKKMTAALDKIIDIIQLHKIQAKNLKKLKQQLLNEILG